jgi:hypothetical protein
VDYEYMFDAEGNRVNPFDPSILSIGQQCTEDYPIPRPGQRDTFLPGPIPWAWWSRAALLPGRALHVASAVCYLTGLERGAMVSFALGDLALFLGVSQQAMRRGLRALESVSLVEVQSRSGWKFRVRVREIENDSDRRRLYGPIPWAWWVRACRLPGRTLHVASAIWAIVGWGGGTSARCELVLDGWADLALGRKAVRRGLIALGSDGLILVESKIGRPSLVTLLPVEPG